MLPNASSVREMQRDKKRSRAKPIITRFLRRSEIDRDFEDFFEEESGESWVKTIFFFGRINLKIDEKSDGFIACESYLINN